MPRDASSGVRIRRRLANVVTTDRECGLKPLPEV